MPSLFDAPDYPFEFTSARRRGGRHRPVPEAEDLHQVRRGVYLPVETWTSMNPDERYRAFVHATLACSPTAPVLSHFSAAALLRLPIVGSWPETVHTIVDEASGGRSSGLYSRHRSAHPPATVIIGGAICTALERTVVDVARTGARASALAMADHALSRRMTSVRALLDEDAALGSGRGSQQSRALLSMASPLAANGGESFVRLLLQDAGFVPPRLQHRYDDDAGLVGYVDFAWPDVGVVLEFDGRRKYVDEEFTAGRSPEEVVWREKRREDRLRALGLRVLRVTWEDLRGATPAVVGLVSAAGVTRRPQTGIEGAR